MSKQDFKIDITQDLRVRNKEELKEIIIRELKEQEDILEGFKKNLTGICSKIKNLKEQVDALRAEDDLEVND